MNRMWRMAAGMSVLLLAAGCLESDTVLRVERDGSGTVVVNAYFSPQITQMLSGMSASMGGEEAPADPIEAMIKDRSSEMGEGVTLVRSERKQNAQGWQGYQAEYRFPDIRKIRLQPGQPPGSGTPDESDLLGFDFTPGDRATLTVRLPAAEEDEEPAEAVNEEQMQAMWPMMKSFFEGMRMTFSVQPASPILETNGRFLSDDRTSLTLVDLAMDRVMENEQAIKILQRQSSDGMKRLAELGIDAARIETPGKKITVTF